MLDRLWWFATGLVVGGVIVTRALRRRPQPGDVKAAAANTAADVLDLAARVVRAPRRSQQLQNASGGVQRGH